MNLFTCERLQTGVLFTINQLSQLLRNMLQHQTLRLDIFVLCSIKYNSKRISKCFYLHNFIWNLVPLKPLSSSTKCTFDNFSYFTDSGNAAQCQHVQKSNMLKFPLGGWIKPWLSSFSSSSLTSCRLCETVNRVFITVFIRVCNCLTVAAALYVFSPLTFT